MGVAVRMTGSGLVHNGHCNLFGITINKADLADSIVRLRNSLDDTGEILWESWLTDKGCFVKNFEPILLFDTGIYIDITGHVYSVIVECQ